MSPSTPPTKSSTPSYSAKDIQVFEGTTAIRKRPGMYVGDTYKRGLDHLFQEVLSNSVDEYLGGHCVRIEVVLEKGGAVRISDDGRGIPIDIVASEKKSGLWVVVNKAHAGAKFGGEGYKVSGGLHGIGVTAVNALSEMFEVTVERDGGKYQFASARGIPKTADTVKLGKSKNHGTTVRWKADSTVFRDAETSAPLAYQRTDLLRMLREQAFLNPGLYISFLDESSSEWFERHYCFEGGVTSFVRYTTKGSATLHPEPLARLKHAFPEVDAYTSVSLAMQYSEESSMEQIHAYTNNIYNNEGGTHVTGFRSAMTRELNNAAKALGVAKGNINLSGEDVTEGLCAVISVYMRGDDIQFEGQTKTKLGSASARGWVDAATSAMLRDAVERQPDVIKKILARCFENREARAAAKAAADSIIKRKGIFDITRGKLVDCDSGSADAELFIVEGDSAGGPAKMGRDRSFQAVLPLKGKIINVEKARLTKVYENIEVKSILTALGAGAGQSFDLTKMRYKRIILMADADDDGAHIAVLLITLFLRLTPGLIEGGHLYIARTPLFRLQKGDKGESRYAYDVAERDAISKEMGGKVNITRFKGLGEMESEDLAITGMSPKTRRLYQAIADDPMRLDEAIKVFMGTDVDARKHLIIGWSKGMSKDIEEYL